MTPLQKAALLAFSRLAVEQAAALAYARLSQAPLFFTSAYGELSPMLRITQSILEHDLPISPKDFQHSVLNAALAYLTMNQNWHQAGFAFSGGYLSADSTLHLASHRLKAGLDTAAIIIHAHEQHRRDGEGEAEAEALILGVETPPHSAYCLQRSEWLAEPRAPGEGTRVYRELHSPELIPWLIEDKGPVLERQLINRKGQALVTTWTAY